MKQSFNIFLIYFLFLLNSSNAIVPFRSSNGKSKDVKLYEDAGKRPIFASVGNMLIETDDKNYRSCSGTLIETIGDFGVFLTARHCLKNNDIKTTSKCTNSRVSFEAEPIWNDTKITYPIIAQIPFEKFGTEEWIPDLGIAIVHLKGEAKNIHPKTINFDVQISEKSNLHVYVAGYGNTELNDVSKTALKRRAMSQSTKTIQMKSRSSPETKTALITDGDNGQEHETEIPWGYSASVGDSGGPMFEAKSMSLIGTVQSGNFSEIETYYEFLPLYKNWFARTVSSKAIKGLMYNSQKSGNWSDNRTWTQGKEPTLLEASYLHSTPIVDIKSHAVEITKPTAVHQVSVGGKGGTLKVKNTHATFDVLSCDAGAAVDSSMGSLRTNALEVNSGDVSFNGGLIIGHKMSVGKDASLDITEGGKKVRDIAMHNNSILEVEGQLKTDSLTMLNGSRVFLNGIIETISGLTQIGGGLYIKGPSTIKGGYSISTNGSLIFEARSAIISTPMLRLAPQKKDKATLDIQNIMIDFNEASRDEEYILLYWENEDKLDLRGTHFSYRGITKTESVKFSSDKNKISVRIISGASPTTEEDVFPTNIPFEN